MKINQPEIDNREVFAHMRVSTGQQSTDSQDQAIATYCKQNGIENYKIFQDEGVSGAKVSRPALDEMLGQIKDGKAKLLIVFSLSRFSRSCSHLLKSLEFLEEHNCKFTSVSEQVETSTIMGRTSAAVLGALSQMEREMVAQRVRAGLAKAKAQGKHIGRKKTRPSEMIRKVLMRGVTYREAAHLCKTSQGSICLEAKEIRNEFKEGRIPNHLTVEDLRYSSFFHCFPKETVRKVISNHLSVNTPPPVPGKQVSSASVSTVVGKQAI